MIETPILVHIDSGVAWITLNRPRYLNAMSQELMTSLRIALEQVSLNRAVRCVALRGAGRAFCAGGDINDIRRRQEPTSEAASIGGQMDEFARTMIYHAESVRLLHTMPKPTVAIVHGHAVGGGLSLALAADIRIAGADSTLRVGFGSLALSGDFGISYFLTRLAGPARARELMLLDPPMTAGAAGDLGLLNYVYPDEALDAEAKALTSRLASGPTIAFGRMKDNLLAAESGGLGQALETETMNQRVTANTNDAREAARAFQERRRAEFTGT
jgi:2-(1,2-epoxy-1,2-dihydrophenyl)acetyl-CoA isomerase